MRILLIVSFVIFCISSSFWSCQKEDLGNLDAVFSDTLQNGPVAKMTARIDGVPWTAIAYDATVSAQPGLITLTGMDDNGETIDITIHKNTSGDYLLSKTSTHLATFAPDSVTTSYYMSNFNTTTGGIVNIATLDSTNAKMSGEFNFIVARTDGTIKTITEGVFTNIDYTNIGLNSAFRAKKNGNVWNPSKVTPSVSGTTLTITADNIDGSKIVLQMPLGVMANTRSYPLTQNGNYKASFMETVNSKPFTLVPIGLKGNPLIISAHDVVNRTIKGTFSFNAKDPSNPAGAGVKITAGVFNITY